ELLAKHSPPQRLVNSSGSAAALARARARRAPVATDTSGRPAGAPSSRSRIWTCASPTTGGASLRSGVSLYSIFHFSPRPPPPWGTGPTSRFCPWQPRRHSTLRRLRRQMVPTRPGHETSPPGCGAQRDVLRAAARHPTGLRLDHVRLAQDPDGAVTTERAPPPPLHSRSPGRRMPSRRFTCQLPVVVFLDFTVFMLHRSSAQAHVVHFVELLHCIWPSTQATIELHHFVHSQPY
ncbi:unnamed protein product, partial [Prorocentrum cordatum]